jgi:hypothetical protein
MTVALEVGEWSAACPGRTLLPGKTRYPLYRRLGGPQGWSGQAENLVPTEIRSQTVQPAVSRYTDWAGRPTHHIYTYLNPQLTAVCQPDYYGIWKHLYVVKTSNPTQVTAYYSIPLCIYQSDLHITWYRSLSLHGCKVVQSIATTDNDSHELKLNTMFSICLTHSLLSRSVKAFQWCLPYVKKESIKYIEIHFVTSDIKNRGKRIMR